MNTNQKHVILGTGPLGLSVATALRKRGICPQMVNRSGEHPAGLPPEVEVIAADLYNPQEVERVTRGAQTVYQCAQPEYTRWPEDFPPLIRSIIQGVSASQARLVVGDNLYMYGPVSGPIHEGLPDTKHGRKGPVRAQVAGELLEAHRSGTLQVVIGRGSDFFGPGVTGSVVGEPVFQALLRDKPANVLGNIDLPHTYTFINDFGEALVRLGERPEAYGQVWHIPNAKPITTRQFVTLAAEALGVRPRMMVAGPLMMRLVGLFVPEVREMIELEYEVTKPYVVNDSKYKKAFGDHATPLEEAIRITAEWYRANHS